MTMMTKPKMPTMRLELRPYQREAVDAVWDYLINEVGNPLVVCPTGSGKALIICELAKRFCEYGPDVRVLVLTHSKELVRQNKDEMLGIWPNAPVGVHNAGLNQWDTTSQIIFGSIQSVHKKAYKFQRVDAIIIDEAQSIPRKADTMWLRFLSDVRTINPYLRCCGATATPFRLDSGRLDRGKDAIFTKIVYDYSIVEAIKDGYLAQPVTRHSATQIDTAGVGTRAGEFIPNQLDARACDPDTVRCIVDELIREGATRPGWIVFGASVKHCEMIRDEIRSRGHSCEGVFATTPNAERDKHVTAFTAGKIDCLVSVSALAVGFNAKHIQIVGLARPTQSVGLYIQAVGRGTRPLYAPGYDLNTREGRLLAIANGPKPECLILDWGGNSQRHGLIDRPNIREPGKGDGSVPYKTCPVCGYENFIAARLCKECGEPFVVEGTKLYTVAASGPLLSTQAAKPEWVKVNSAQYDLHQKPGNPPTLRATYHCGLMAYREWIAFESEKYAARMNAATWWNKRAGTEVPSTIAEAIERKSELRTPTEIAVRPKPSNPKFMEILGSKF